MSSSSGKAMKCTKKCMELSSFVVGFDIVELWTCDPNGNYHCSYVHATESALAEQRDKICGVGHNADPNVTHRVSPNVSDGFCCIFGDSRAEGDRESNFYLCFCFCVWCRCSCVVAVVYLGAKIFEEMLLASADCFV